MDSKRGNGSSQHQLLTSQLKKILNRRKETIIRNIYSIHRLSHIKVAVSLASGEQSNNAIYLM